MPSIPVRRPLSLSALACGALVAVAACAAASPPAAGAKGAVSVVARTVATSPPAPAIPRSAHVAAGQTLRQVWPAGADTAWAWTQDLSGAPQGLARTVNGGRTWASVTPPGLTRQLSGKVITGFFALGAQHAWVTYGGIKNGAAQHIAATTDGGRRWTVVGREPLTTVGFSTYVYDCGLDFVTPSVGWCQAEPPYVGSEGVDLYRTTDGGRHWRRVSVTGPNANKPGSLPWGGDKDIQFTSRSTGWASFTGPKAAPLYETTNGGRTWIKRGVAAPPGGPIDSGSGFAGLPLVAGRRGAVGYTIDGSPLKAVVYVSTDRGLAWRPVTPPGAPQGWVVDAISGTSWRLVAGDHILATDNAGRTWRTITSNVTFRVYYAYDDPTPPVVDFVTSQTGWIAGTALWRTTDGGHTWRRLAVPGT
jgi:photosystem II stability/assembly factor-like uncharacterized protein